MKRTYRVVGSHAIDGHLPGATFTAAYSAEHEAFLVGAGHLERAPKAAAEADATSKEEVKKDG